MCKKMDAGFPAFRNRKSTRRADYMPLDSDSDAESFRRSNTSIHGPPERPRDVRGVKIALCDKYWQKQERTRACKRCLDCKENLCKLCARCDEVTRPWWVPSWVAQCWRFLFADAFKPHSIVDLHTYGGVEEPPHWVHSREANRMQRIPRLSQTSFRSNNSNQSGAEKAKRRDRGRSSSWSNGKDKRRKGNADSRCQRRLEHSQSFDGLSSRRLVGRSGIGPMGAGALAHNYRHDDVERLRRYKDNWERAFDENNHEFKQVPFQNKMRGKDVMIELSDKDAKVIVNTLNNESKQRKKELGGKRNPKRKKSETPPEKITEGIFQEVPIWFKKDSKANGSDSKRKDSAISDEYCKVNPKQQATSPSNETRNKFNRNFYAERTSGVGNMSRKPTNRVYNDNFTNTAADNIRNTRNGEYLQKPTNPDFVDPSNGNKSRYTSNAYTNYIVEEPADACTICLDELPGGEARALACSHCFHSKCLLHLLRTTDMDFGITCPVCSQTTHVRNYYATKEQWLRELPISSTV